MTKPSDNTLVIIPTYNEVENLPLIVGRVLDANPQVKVLVVDDNSPDGTGDKADELAAEQERVSVLHRTTKDGLLGAYLAGFSYGLEKDFEVLVQMDADGSHAPEQLHRLLDEIDDDADLVIGSRYIEGGEVVNWPKDRQVLSRGGNLYIGAALGTGLTDMTAGYRAIRREVLETIDLDDLDKAGYIFQVDLAFKAWQEIFDVREVPITFTDRTLGDSKMDGSFVKDSLGSVTKWGVEHRFTQASELAKEMGKLVGYQYRESPLPSLPRKIREAGEYARNFAEEMGKLAKYEYNESPIKEHLENLRMAGSQTKEFGKEMAGLAKYEAGQKR